MSKFHEILDTKFRIGLESSFCTSNLERLGFDLLTGFKFFIGVPSNDTN